MWKVLVQYLNLKDQITLERVCKGCKRGLSHSWSTMKVLDVAMIPSEAWRQYRSQPFISLVERVHKSLQDIRLSAVDLPRFGYKAFMEILVKAWDLDIKLRKVCFSGVPLHPRFLMHLAKFPTVERLAIFSFPPPHWKDWEIIDAMPCLCFHHWPNLQQLILSCAVWPGSALEHLPDSLERLTLQHFLQPRGKRLQLTKILFDQLHPNLKWLYFENMLVRRHSLAQVAEFMPKLMLPDLARARWIQDI